MKRLCPLKLEPRDNMQLGKRTGEIIRRSHVRRRSDGFQPMSDYFESRQEAPTGTIEISAHSETLKEDNESLLGAERLSHPFGGSINCSPILPCSNEPAGDDTAWKGTFDELRSELKPITNESIPLHKKLRELLEENSRSFDQLRERQSILASAVKQQRSISVVAQEIDQSSSISFRRTSSRLSHGPEHIRADVSIAPASSVNVFENSDPPIHNAPESIEIPLERELSPSPNIKEDNSSKVPSHIVRDLSVKEEKKQDKQKTSPPVAEGKRTVKTKNVVMKKNLTRKPYKKAPHGFIRAFDTEPELKGIIISPEAIGGGRYQRRRHYAPLFDFLYENVTRDSKGDICLQIADLKNRPPKRKYDLQKKTLNPSIEIDGIIAERVDEDEKNVTYRFRLSPGKLKPLAKASLPIQLWAESCLKKCLICSIGKTSHDVAKTLLDGKQPARISTGEVYMLENPGRRRVTVSLQIFKHKEKSRPSFS